MRAFAIALGLVLAGGTVAAQPAPQSVAEPPLSDTRVGIDTLVREDLFAGYLAHDMARFEKGDKNLETLLQVRPQDRAEIMSWQGADQLYRAVLARDAGQTADYAEFYRQGMETLAASKEIADATGGHGAGAGRAVTGGIMMVLADRLAPEDRPAAWAAGYEAFQFLKKGQPKPETLPVHYRGELMAGLVQSAQRTGRREEMDAELDQMLTVTKGTPYDAMAQKWKDDPDIAATGALGCKSCHEPGRLAPTLARLQPKPS